MVLFPKYKKNYIFFILFIPKIIPIYSYVTNVVISDIFISSTYYSSNHFVRGQQADFSKIVNILFSVIKIRCSLQTLRY